MHDDHPPVRQFAGAPPNLGMDGSDRHAMPWPRVVVIVEREDGFFLERFLADGTVVGDTSHVDAAEAREQAQWEYGSLLGAWIDIPEQLPEEAIAAFTLGRQ